MLDELTMLRARLSDDIDGFIANYGKVTVPAKPTDKANEYLKSVRDAAKKLKAVAYDLQRIHKKLSGLKDLMQDETTLNVLGETIDAFDGDRLTIRSRIDAINDSGDITYDETKIEDPVGGQTMHPSEAIDNLLDRYCPDVLAGLKAADKGVSYLADQMDLGPIIEPD